MHVPASIRNETVLLRLQPKRDCKSDNLALCDSAIGKHLLSSTHCENSYSDHDFRVAKNVAPYFNYASWRLY